MNQTGNNTVCISEIGEIDASCRVPLLALFGGAALWLVLGLVLGLAASMSFHNPKMFADCPYLSFGRAQAAANDLILYGFVVPAALGVMLWVLARLSQAPLALPIVPIAAANIWHLGVLAGTVGILAGHSTGYTWLEYPRIAAVLLFAAFMLIAVSAVATMGTRARREMYPSHWFLFASILWFAWTFSSANLFLQSAHPPRGVVQAIIGWWFANNIIFVWLGLVGIGLAFYFLPKISGKPLATSGYVTYAFLAFILFGTWSGIPHGAPVPAWLPTITTFMSGLTLIPVVAIAIITSKTLSGASVECFGGPFCFIKFGTYSFILSAVLYLGQFCPHASRILEFTWYGVGVTQWQLFGFAGMILLGGIYEILPKMMGKEIRFPMLAKASFFAFAGGVVVYVIPLLIGGYLQGTKLNDSSVEFAKAGDAALLWFRISTTGQLILLLGSLLLLLNVLVMTIQWKLGLVKTTITVVKDSLKSTEVNS